MTTRRSPRIVVVGLLLAIAAAAASVGSRVPPSSSSSPLPATTPADVPRSDGASGGGGGRGERRHLPGEDPGIANLDPALLGALRQAATDAAAEGVRFSVESGWRSPEHQQRLLFEAIAKYGSEAEAARWVATPETSPHVSGDAVDVGPAAAMAWLSARGAAYGLCQIYGNEPWHYELRPEAVHQGCPPAYADPTHDPRMWR